MAALYVYKASLVPPFVSMYKFGCPRMHASYVYKGVFFQHGQKQIHHTTNSKSLLYTMPRHHASTHSEDEYFFFEIFFLSNSKMFCIYTKHNHDITFSRSICSQSHQHPQQHVFTASYFRVFHFDNFEQLNHSQRSHSDTAYAVLYRNPNNN